MSADPDLQTKAVSEVFRSDLEVSGQQAIGIYITARHLYQEGAIECEKLTTIVGPHCGRTNVCLDLLFSAEASAWHRTRSAATMRFVWALLIQKGVVPISNATEQAIPKWYSGLMTLLGPTAKNYAVSLKECASLDGNGKVVGHCVMARSVAMQPQVHGLQFAGIRVNEGSEPLQMDITRENHH